MQLERLHHVTCVCSDAQRTTDFYRDELGFTLVKKTVNFDDPHSYHLYFGDEVGSPGSLITFFEWPRSDRGRLGRGTLESIGLVHADGRHRDRPRGSRRAAACASFPPGARAFTTWSRSGTPTCTRGSSTRTRRSSFAAPVEEAALIGAGTAHHIAFRTPGDAEQAAWIERLTELGLRPTTQQDRKYFRSVYFRMPDGILVEIATDGPGFLVDEPPATLGQGLSLPPWLEPERETLERELVPIV